MNSMASSGGHYSRPLPPPPPQPPSSSSPMMATNATHVMRIMRDLREFYKENSQDMYAVAEDDDITRVHALILGPNGTPYEKGFFYFTLIYPTNYPIKPPIVKLMTTGEGKVRFNPNLYACGKVCLSILGTWSGPAWTAAQTLFTTLLSIQSLMNEKPYHNEPGYEEFKGLKSVRYRRRSDVDTNVKNYNDMICYETLRIAIIGMMNTVSGDSRNMPQSLQDIMISLFKLNYDYYERTIRSRLQSMNGQPIVDPFHSPSRPKTFQYSELLDQLLKLKHQQNIGTAAAAVDLSLNIITGQSSSSSSSSSTSMSSSSTGSSSSAAVATNAADIRTDPLSKSYYEMVNKKVAEVLTEPRPEPDPQDTWDELIDQLNDDLNDEDNEFDGLEYESDDDDDDNDNDIDDDDNHSSISDSSTADNHQRAKAIKLDTEVPNDNHNLQDLLMPLLRNPNHDLQEVPNDAGAAAASVGVGASSGDGCSSDGSTTGAAHHYQHHHTHNESSN